MPENLRKGDPGFQDDSDILVRLISNKSDVEREKLKREVKQRYRNTTMLRFIRAGLAELGIEL
jgi:hypothetical protein